MASSSDNFRPLERKLLRWWTVVCVGVSIAFCASQLIEIPVRSSLRGYDNTFNYLWLRSAMVDHDWDFRNDLVACNTLTPEYRAAALALPVTPTGRIPNKYGVGWAATTAPFYWVADLIVSIGRAVGVWSYSNDGFNPVYQICIQIGHALLAGLSLLLAMRAIEGWVGCRLAAWAGVISVWSASSLIYYQSVNVAMSHSAAFFSIAMLAWSLNRASIEPAAKIPWLLAGASWGLGVTVRYQLAVFLLPAAWVLARGVLARRPLLAPVTFFMLGALPLLAGQLFAWHSVYGEWLVFSYGVEGESFHWGNPMVLNSLFSPWHGLFYWHPFTAVGLLGLGIWLWRNPRTAGPWAMVFFLICYINAAWWCWWFASAFGNRGYDAALLPLMAGMAWLFVVARGQARTLLWTGAVIFGLWNFYLILLYRSGAISRNEPVTWVEMLKASSRLGAALKF